MGSALRDTTRPLSKIQALCARHWEIYPKLKRSLEERGEQRVPLVAHARIDLQAAGHDRLGQLLQALHVVVDAGEIRRLHDGFVVVAVTWTSGARLFRALPAGGSRSGTIVYARGGAMPVRISKPASSASGSLFDT